MSTWNYVAVCVTLSVCVCVYARGLGCVVYADARRLSAGGAPHARHTDVRLRSSKLHQRITCEHGAPPSCALSVHTIDSTASAAQLALPPATAAHGLAATLAWQS